jgi:hypothetical protein
MFGFLSGSDDGPRSLDDIIENVRDLAEQYPDAVYRSGMHGLCSYTSGKAENGPDGEGCLLGQASISSFFEDYDLSLNERVMVHSVICKLEREGLLKDVTDQKVKWLKEVQYYQDRRNTWSEAVRGADQMIGNPLEKE